MKSVQPPNFRDNYTLTLTPDELSLLKTALIEHLAHGGRDQDILDALYSKLQLTLSSDGACLRPAQPLEAVVEQGGLIRDSVRHGGTVVPDHICGQCYTDKSDSHSCNRDDCLEKSISGVQDCTCSARLSGLICYQCEKRVAYLFDDSRCKDCTRLTREEIEGNVVQGGSISKYAHYSGDELQNEIEFLSYENGRVARGHASQVSESLIEALEEKARRSGKDFARLTREEVEGVCNFPEKMTARSGGPRCQFCELTYLEAPGCEGCRFHTAKVSDVALPEEVGQGGTHV